MFFYIYQWELSQGQLFQVQNILLENLLISQSRLGFVIWFLKYQEEIVQHPQQCQPIHQTRKTVC